jgi:hypothetical protein
MRPITAVILSGSILVAAVVLRIVVLHTGFLPVNEEVILRKAVRLRVNYTVRGVVQMTMINDRDEVADLLSSLRIRRDREEMIWGGPRFGGGFTNSVEFVFAGGGARSYSLHQPTLLGHLEIDPLFYSKLTDSVSRRLGWRVNLLGDNP